MANHSTLRISKEISEVQKGTDLSIAIAFRDDNIRKVRAIIVGPPDTPYEFGFFEFKVSFGKDYPTSPPNVVCITTNQGRTRFNPNIYATGKVCLSILGTWRGERGEEWSSAQGLESILISIQSLMSANPYENEPGFEVQQSREEKKMATQYAAKLKHESLRITVIDRLEGYLGLDPTIADAQSAKGSDGPLTGLAQEAFKDDKEPPFEYSEPFADFCKRRFLWYYDQYVLSIQAERDKHGDTVAEGQKFANTRFECNSNQAQGSYCYTALLKRLETVRKAIDQETESWAEHALAAKRRESPVTMQFENKFKHIHDELKRRALPVDLEMINGNPCVWRLTLFGRPMTNLDGGIFRVRMNFSINFPATEKPRVVVETPIFHSRVSKDGVLCYFPQDQDDLASHLDAIIEAIETEQPPYDPRTLVHHEAATLCWGTAEQRKLYNRKLRRSAQDSIEFSIE